MLKGDYDRAVALCKESIDGGYDLTASHAASAGVPFDSAQSLRRQMFARTQYRAGWSIIDIARQPGLRFSPYLMARILAEALEPGVKVAQLMRSPSLIVDDRLRGEVERCLEEDMDYSPFIDRLKRGLGAEYEFILQQKLRARGVAFESESDLREKGAYKTPDMLLQIPMAVTGPRNEWVVVSWIDSKAMFGDEHTYVKEHQSQLLSYVNRYGPGLVIYWFGFVETLLSPAFEGYRKDIMVMADFPSPIMLPDGQLL